MGMDIHIYMEYRERKTNRYKYYREFETPRRYGLFGILADVFNDVNPLYISRGFPNDASDNVYKEYRNWGGDAHHVSWLDAEEFGYCLDYAKELYPDASEDWLKESEFILKNLRDSDNEGEPARIIFWFDN